MKIGFLDSGLGGITVLKEALKLLPNEDYLYYADTLHVPYGEKSKDEVKGYIFDAVDFLISQGIKALVVACNTATSIAINDLRLKYDFPVIGMEPAVKPAVIKNGFSGKRVLVFATALTLTESKFHELVSQVDQNNIVDFLPLPGLVILAEKLEFGSDTVIPYLKEKLSSYDLSLYGTVVLGCTHFPLFIDSFKKILPQDIDIIDGAYGTIKHLKALLEENHLTGSGNGHIDFYSSGNVEEDRLKFVKGLSFANGL